MWCAGGRNGKPLQYSCLENPTNSMKRQKDITLEVKSPRSEGIQYTTGEEWRAITNSSRKKEVAGPKQKRCPVVDVSGGESKVWCYKEHLNLDYIGTWNVRSMNQGKLDVFKQEMARGNIDILAISGLKWTGMGKFNSGDHFICYCGQESLRRNGIALIINKGVWNAVLGCNLKNDRMISVCFQGKPLKITVIQVSVPSTNDEVKQFYEDQQDPMELTLKKKKCPFHYRGLECKSRTSSDTWSNWQV